MGNFHLVSQYRKTTQSSLTRGQEMWLPGTSFDLLWGYSLGWALCSKVRAPPVAALGKTHRMSRPAAAPAFCTVASAGTAFTLQGADSGELAASAWQSHNFSWEK